MESVRSRGRHYRREVRRRGSNRLQHKYNYRGVKTAILFSIGTVLAIYLVTMLVTTGLGSVLQFLGAIASTALGEL